jgi:hypothetical protein
MLPSFYDFILINTLFKTILLLDELSQNRKKSRKILPIERAWDISDGGVYSTRGIFYIKKTNLKITTPPSLTFSKKVSC